MTRNGPDRDDVRDLLDRFGATRRGPPGGPGGSGGGGGPPGGRDDELSERQREKIDHIVGQVRESNAEAMAAAEALRRREIEAGVPRQDADGNLSPGTRAYLDALCGGGAHAFDADVDGAAADGETEEVRGR
ncbi:hypothetical protein [Halococcus saccharolyticus]|uniref:Uncharacterized protein n=1 Tax=Halococcus saccharolyticus DSM 5350 TaxID=1227455 RepID=M0MIJ4_9EURY|nr:hypothetical protein [Halococcus saccharolyticus]EMA44275.1 hypothetical protein C449_12133 [Halococcus saccharolyticus DSM 5350]